MITVDGLFGRGAQWCVFNPGYINTDGTGYCNQPIGLSSTPVTEFLLPPPDNVKYSCLDSAYGPRSAVLQVGMLNSHSGLDTFNPCQHSTMSGSLTYRNGATGMSPQWRCNGAMTASGYYTRSGVPLSWHSGRPANTSSLKNYNYQGTLVTIPTTGYQPYWYNNNAIVGNVVPDAMLSTLPPGSSPFTFSQWYGKRLSGGVPTLTSSVYHYVEWEKTSPTRWVRKWYIEVHDTSGYASSARVSPFSQSTGLGYLVDANERITEYNLEFIRSPKAGIYLLTVSSIETLNYWGWQPWDYFSGTKFGSNTIDYQLLNLAPGLSTAGPIPTVDMCNTYCQLASDRAQVIYSHKLAREARTCAMNDVTGLDSNWIENLAGVKGTADVLNPLVDGANAVAGGDLKLARQALMSAYLSYCYVIAPAISDKHDLSENGKSVLNLISKYRYSNERRRGMYMLNGRPVGDYIANITYTCAYHLLLKTNVFSTIWNALEKVGLQPTPGQAWDLIPFSFVVDWFANIGDALRTVDNYCSSVVNRTLRGRIEGFKVQWVMPEREIGELFDNLTLNGSALKYSWYDRRVYDSFGTFSPFAGQNADGLSVSQMTQASALLSSYR